MESNIKIKDTPKLKISSTVFGDKDIAGNSTGSIKNIHKTLSKLSGHVRKSLIRIKGLEEKFSKVESKTEVGNIGKKLSGGSNVNQSLVETNRILVEIQKQITTAFGMRNEEEKEKNKTLKKEKSKEKLRLKEGAIESVRKIGGAIKKTAQFVAAPFKGFFDKILEFITLLGLGIGANAVFKWFEDEENRKKMSKFFNIIVSNWKLIRNILGTMVVAGLALKIVALATSIGGVLAFLANPITLKVLAAIAAGVLLYKAGKFIVKGIRNLADGGENFTEAYDQLNQQLEDVGMTSAGVSKNRSRQEIRTNKSGRNEEQEKVFKEVSGKRDKLDELRKTMDAEVTTKQGEIDYTKLGDKPGTVGAMGSGTGSNRSAAQAKVKSEVEESYIPKIQSILEGRAKGGPVTAKTPYLVGESGPEIFAPNVDGSIINNMRTEKIYQMISSKDAGKINFITMELPPKVMKKEQQDSTQQTAPPVPSISPVNGSNPYMNTTPEIYGIYV